MDLWRSYYGLEAEQQNNKSLRRDKPLTALVYIYTTHSRKRFARADHPLPQCVHPKCVLRVVFATTWSARVIQLGKAAIGCVARMALLAMRLYLYIAKPSTNRGCEAMLLPRAKGILPFHYSTPLGTDFAIRASAFKNIGVTSLVI